MKDNSKKIKLVPIILLLLAVFDLRIEIRLLIDHLTFTSILYSIKEHTLAIAILVFSPSLFKVYNRN
mgnify:CR=1 FL=1